MSGVRPCRYVDHRGFEWIADGSIRCGACHPPIARRIAAVLGGRSAVDVLGARPDLLYVHRPSYRLRLMQDDREPFAEVAGGPSGRARPRR